MSLIDQLVATGSPLHMGWTGNGSDDSSATRVCRLQHPAAVIT